MTTDCNFGEGKNLPPEAVTTPIECAHCHAEVPATVASSFEGADYLYHFCGPTCLDAWCRATRSHDK